MDRGEKHIIDLVNAWAAYSAAHADADIAGFCLNYLTQQTQTTTVADQFMADRTPADETGLEALSADGGKSMIVFKPEARLAALVGRLSKFAYFYSKKAMQPFDFKGVEDPIYLVALMEMGTPKKSELIYEMMAEFASGIDVINRLVHMGLIGEVPDEQDRRSKRLHITPKGIEAIQECFPVLDKVVDVAYSSLNEAEKVLLVGILDKLDRYHTEHYRLSKNADFDEVYERMVG